MSQLCPRAPLITVTTAIPEPLFCSQRTDDDEEEEEDEQPLLVVIRRPFLNSQRKEIGLAFLSHTDLDVVQVDSGLLASNTNSISVNSCFFFQ